MNRLVLGLVAIALLAGTARDAGAQARTVRMTSSLGVPQVFAVLLPRSYAESEVRYPVVYLFHGGGQDHTAYMARNAFRQMAPTHEVIVVMPAADRSYSARSAAGQAQYHTFIATELVPFVDAQYRTIASREGRAIAGLSMGGRIAAMTALQHPQQFGTVGAFSAALGPDAVAAVESTAAGTAPYVYLSCGTADSLIGVNRAFAERLATAAVPHEYHEAPGLGHVWEFWDEQVGVFFDVAAARFTAARAVQR